jgi:glycosyltransferase involved in cell wall biosynthesis
MPPDALVSIGLPVYNGETSIEAVAKSVLDQDYENIELVISDNASTDRTEEVGRMLAAIDARVVFHRQPENVGLIGNFLWTRQNARGSYFRWIGDDDEISQTYVSRCLDEFATDPRLILVTTQLSYTSDVGSTQSQSERYDGIALRSEDAATRFAEMLRLLTAGYQVLDPVYGMVRTDAVIHIPYYSGLRGDELYATRLALAGPWGHIPEVLGRRHWRMVRLPRLAPTLDAPRWHALVANLRQCSQLLAQLDQANLTPAQRQRARGEIARLYVRRHWRTANRGARKVANVVGKERRA